MNTSGKEEVKDGVLIAGITAVITGVIAWGFEEGKKVIEARRQKEAKDKQSQEDERIKELMAQVLRDHKEADAK